MARSSSSSEKITWRGRLIGVQPRIRLLRSSPHGGDGQGLPAWAFDVRRASVYGAGSYSALLGPSEGYKWGASH
jgi:hypothetical protein